jgi:methyl-accepting chemotaxis protein
MASSLEIVRSVIDIANKAQEQITQASNLVEQASAISINVAAAVEQQATTTDDIAKSAETLRSTVQIDIEKVEILGQESIRMSKTASEMENNIARFK